MLVAILLGAESMAARGQNRSNNWTIDTSQSRVTVHVFRAGLLSPALHDHHFRPESWSGTIFFDLQNPQQIRLEVTIAAGSLHDHETALSAKDVEKVERQVRGEKILDATRYPEIQFTADRAEIEKFPSGGSGEVQGTLVGTLTLHGRSRTLRLAVRGHLSAEKLEANARVSFKQSDFGIEPYTALLGTISVKDEVKVELSLVAVSAAAGGETSVSAF